MKDVFPGIKQIPLKNPHINGVHPDDKDLLRPHIELMTGILDKIDAGERVYLGITSGERKGSIAYIHFVIDHYRNGKPGIRYSGGSWDNKVRIKNDTIYCVLGWDKRRNKIQWSSYQDGTVYLPDYTGPTVWKKYDKKKEAEKYLKEHLILDREDNVLIVGDRVFYINARYGGGASLDRGTITEIKVTMQVHGEQKWPTTHVIIKNDDDSMSDIREHGQSVLKIHEPRRVTTDNITILGD